MFGPFLLPSGHREKHYELQRYVRHEFRDDNACWFGTENGHGPCVRLPGEGARKAKPKEQAPPVATRAHEGACGCPVLGTISKCGTVACKASRGETSGRL